jgi:hypothetical protein
MLCYTILYIFVHKECMQHILQCIRYQLRGYNGGSSISSSSKVVVLVVASSSSSSSSTSSNNNSMKRGRWRAIVFDFCA